MLKTPEQDFIDKGVENSITDNIRKDMEDAETKKKTKSQEEPEKKETKSTEEEPEKKPVDKNKSNTDTDNDDVDLAELHDAAVQRAIDELYDGDESKRDEAERIVNVAAKTFDGDPLKAAKSYKNLADQHLRDKELRKKNPFIDRLISDAQKGQTIDENYVAELLGTATSKADQPTNKDKEAKVDQLEDEYDASKLMNMSAEDLIEEGLLDKTKYEAQTPAAKQDMLQQARLNYAMNVVPVKMAKKAAQLTKEEQKKQKQQEIRDNAASTNQQRLNQNLTEVVKKYNVDFENNPEHMQLFDEVQKKAYKIPDLDDDNDLLVAENAVEQAVKHVFGKHNIPLKQTNVSADTPETDDTKSDHKTPMNNVNNMSAYERILRGSQGFKGKSGQSKKPSNREEEENPNTLDARVNQRVNNAINRNYTNSHLISGARKKDRQKGQ